MKKTSPLVLMALLGGLNVQAVQYPEKEGHCPFDAGVLVSNVKDTLNAHRLTGRWMNIFDRHSLNEEHKCYGVKLMHSYAYDEGDGKIHDEVAMKDVERIFEYIKATNVGESGQDDPKTEEELKQEAERPAYEDSEVDLLSYGYHVYNGFQLHFKDPKDKSIAHLVHRDVNLKDHQDGSIKEHGHDGKLEEWFDEHLFDSQFKRYAQVLDTDYDNYMLLYQCFETAHYYDKSGTRIPDYEAWEHAKSSSVNFSAWPQSSFKFDETVVVKPRHFENVKILWRPRAFKQEYIEPETLEGSDIKPEELKQELDAQPLEYRYPKEMDEHKMKAKVEELKKQITAKVPNIELEHYNLLDHQSGRCDYDPYDRYDAEWHDEANNFGHMFSEAVPSSYQESGEPVPPPTDGEKDDTPEEDDTTLYDMYENPGEEEEQEYTNPDDTPGDFPEDQDEFDFNTTQHDEHEEPQPDNYEEEEQPDITDGGPGYEDFESEGEL